MESSSAIFLILSVVEIGKKKIFYREKKRKRSFVMRKIFRWKICKEFAATGIESFKNLAIDNMQFLQKKVSNNESSEFFHSWKNDIAKQPAFLDDYAFLIQA